VTKSVSSPVNPSGVTSAMSEAEILDYFRVTCNFCDKRGRPLVLDVVFQELLSRAGVVRSGD
jgi:hypothetical protein